MAVGALAHLTPCHQQPWLWLCRLKRSWSYVRKDVNHIHRLCVNCKCIFMFYEINKQDHAGSNLSDVSAALLPNTSHVCALYKARLDNHWCSEHVDSLQWRQNECDSVSNHRRLDCLLNRLFGHRSKKTSKSASLALVWGIHRWPVNSPHKGPVMWKMFPFDDVIMVK